MKLNLTFIQQINNTFSIRNFSLIDQSINYHKTRTEFDFRMYLKMLAQRLTLLSALLGFVSAGISVGHCPHVSAVHVGETNFAGRWYEIRRVKPEDEGGETCNFEEYNFRKDVNGMFFLYFNIISTIFPNEK